jgi:4-amino-4-deoxy-L-arabinose transferase-like glycosyltransferase
MRMRRYSALLVLLGVFTAVAVSYGLLNPIGEAPDEAAHVRLIRFIGQTGHLPRTDADRERAGYKSDTPMLYHLLVGTALSWVDYAALPSLKESSVDPRRLLVADGLSPWAVIHTEDEAWPWRGIVLAWHLARLASTLFSVATVVVVYRAVLAAVQASGLDGGGANWFAVGAVALVALNPQFTFIAASVNDDNLLGLLASLFALYVIDAWRSPTRIFPYAGAGICLGLALTTKYSVVLLPAVVVVLLIVHVRRSGLELPAALKRLAVFGAAFCGAAAWWFAFVVWNFKPAVESGFARGVVTAVLGGSRADASMQQVTSLLLGGTLTGAGGSVSWPDWIVQMGVTFWLPGNPLDRPAGIVLCLAVAGIVALAVAGLLRRLIQAAHSPLGAESPELAGNRTRRSDGITPPIPAWLLALAALQMILLLPFPVLRYHLTSNVAEAAQGRHILFPAVVSVGLLLMTGLTSLAARRQRRAEPPDTPGRIAVLGDACDTRTAPVIGVATIFPCVLLVINLYSFFGLVLPAYPPPLPVRTGVAADQVAQPLDLAFGDTIELVDVDVGAWSAHGTLPVTLTWRSTGYSSTDYLTDLLLVDSDDVVRARWLGHPVDGRYPSRAWEPGDVVRDRVWLAAPGCPADEYRLCLRLLPTAMAGHPEPYTGDCARVSRVTLPAAPLPAEGDQPAVDVAGQRLVFTVWQSGAPAAAVPVYRNRATIQISLSEPAADAIQSMPVTLSLVGPDDVERPPVLQTGHTYSFLVEAGWPPGVYRLRIREDADSVDSAPVLEVRVRKRSFDVPSVSRRVDADFGGEIVLLGFDFPERRVRPGGTLPITLYWQAQRDIQAHYIVFNHLLGADLRQWGGRDRIPRDYYSTALWAAGEVVRDDYSVPVDPAAPPGVYRLDVGLYEMLGGQVRPVWLVAGNQALDANSVLIGEIKVGGPPPGVIATTPAPEHSRADRLGDLVTLLGYDLAIQPEKLAVTLYWRCDRPLLVDYTTFVHVVEAGTGETVAQMDRPPVDGTYPTSLWDVGEVIRDVVEVPLTGGVPPGDYVIRVGLYNAASGQRLPVPAAADGAVLLTTVRLGDGQ